MNLPSACACLGPQFNEPHCPCTMHRLGLPPSQERLDYIAFQNTPEQIEKSKQEWEKLKQHFEKSK
jgi:hypothetical protein